MNERAIHKNLAFGSKTLSVDIYVDRASATMRFGTRNIPLIGRRIPGETTRIFLEGEQVIQKAVESTGSPIRLQFDTANTRLKAWLRARKEELGLRVEPEEDTGDVYRLTESKNYTPVKSDRDV